MVENYFKGRHFQKDIILVAVGYYFRPELFIPSKKVVSFHVFQKLTTFDLAYYVLRL